MIVGSNGAGKTNLLRALTLCLTGDAGGVAKKPQNVAFGTPRGTASYAQCMLEHGNVTGIARRPLLPATDKDTLCFGNTPENDYVGHDKVNEAMWEWLGVTKKQIDDYVFVKQRKIDELIDRTETERGRELASLFGLHSAATIHSKLGTFVSAISLPVVTGIDNMRSEVGRLEQTIVDLDSRLGEYADLPEDTTDMRAALGDRANAFEARQVLERDRDQPRADLSAASEALQTVVAAIVAADADIAIFDTAMVQMRDAYVEATEALSTYDTLERSANSRAALEQQRASLATRALYTDPDYPVRPEYLLQEAELRQQAAPMSAEIIAKASAINNLDGQSATCQTCGQAMPGADARAVQRTKLVAERLVLVDAVSPLAEKIDACVKYAVAWNATVRARYTLYTEIQTWKGHWATIPKLETPSMSKTRATEVSQSYHRYVNGKQTFASQQPARKERRAELEATQLAKTAEIGRINAKLSQTLNLTVEESAAAMQALTLLCERERARTTLRAQRQEAASSLVAWRQQLAEAVTREQETAGARYAVEYLTTLRNIFHPNEAPRMVSLTYMQQIEGQVNEVLRLFDAPFSVRINDTLGFVACFYDTGKEMEDRRLSVGERIVLSMAFRIAVNSTFAGSLGLLVLDEPTAGLDEHNLGCLPRALERLRTLSEERGLQIIFVTHEPRIAGYFDHVIDLGAEPCQASD